MGRLVESISAGEERNFNLEGTFFYIESATQPVEVSFNNSSSIRMEEFGLINILEGIKTVRIRNSTNRVCQITAQTGTGDFKPPYNGQQVAIRNFPAVQPVQLMIIDGQKLPVTIENYKSVQAVKQSGKFFTAPPSGSVKTAVFVLDENGSNTIPANQNRWRMLISASSDNSAPVLMASQNGEPVPVNNVELHSGEQLTLSGTAGDKVNCIFEEWPE